MKHKKNEPMHRMSKTGHMMSDKDMDKMMKEKKMPPKKMMGSKSKPKSKRR